MGRFLLLIMVLTSIFSCEPDPFCREESDNVVILGFRDGNDSTYAMKIQTIRLDNNDTTYVGDTTANLFLPLDPFQQVTSFTFTWADPRDDIEIINTDELHIRYKVNSRVFDPDCPVIRAFVIDTAFTTFDSLIISNKIINEAEPLDIILYFTPL